MDGRRGVGTLRDGKDAMSWEKRGAAETGGKE